MQIFQLAELEMNTTVRGRGRDIFPGPKSLFVSTSPFPHVNHGDGLASTTVYMQAQLPLHMLVVANLAICNVEDVVNSSPILR